MSRTCDIDKTHESHQLIHYLDTLGESEDSIITVESPRNLQQCRSTIYEYGIVNNIKNCECKVSTTCGVLNGGGCHHDSSGGYNLHLEIRQAWSALTPTSRGSERICENKLYQRTLINNDMILLRMTLHDDPQDRNPEEKFVCTVQRTCYLMNNGRKHTPKTNTEISTPSNTGLTSKHQEQTFILRPRLLPPFPSEDTSPTLIPIEQNYLENPLNSTEPSVNSYSDPMSTTLLDSYQTSNIPSLHQREQEPSSDNTPSSTVDPIYYNNQSLDIQSSFNPSQINVTLQPTRADLPSLPNPKTQSPPEDYTSNTTKIGHTQENYTFSDHQLKENGSQLILTLYVNQTPVMTRNITLDGMPNIDLINIINVNAKTIVVTTDEDISSFSFFNISTSSSPANQSYKKYINETYLSENNKVSGNRYDSLADTTAQSQQDFTTKPSKDRPLLDEKLETILPLINPHPEKDNHSRNNTLQLPLTLPTHITLACNKVLDSLMAVATELISLFQHKP